MRKKSIVKISNNDFLFCNSNFFLRLGETDAFVYFVDLDLEILDVRNAPDKDGNIFRVFFLGVGIDCDACAGSNIFIIILNY